MSASDHHPPKSWVQVSKADRKFVHMSISRSSRAQLRARTWRHTCFDSNRCVRVLSVSCLYQLIRARHSKLVRHRLSPSAWRRGSLQGRFLRVHSRQELVYTAEIIVSTCGRRVPIHPHRVHMKSHRRHLGDRLWVMKDL